MGYTTDFSGSLTMHFFEPWGRKLNGEISWQGEDSDDRGVIYVRENEVAAVRRNPFEVSR